MMRERAGIPAYVEINVVITPSPECLQLLSVPLIVMAYFTTWLLIWSHHCCLQVKGQTAGLAPLWHAMLFSLTSTIFPAFLPISKLSLVPEGTIFVKK